MLENLKTLKNWWKFAKPNKKLFCLSSFAVILAYTCLILAPLFAAKVIIAINAQNWWGAVLYLSIVFGLLCLRQLFWHMNYYFYNKIVGSVFKRLNLEFVDKVYNAKNSNFIKTPKEKLLNILHTEIFNLGDTADKAAMCIGRIYMLIVTVIIIFTINVWVGIAVIACDVINFLLLNFLETRRTKRQKQIREDIDQEYTLFSKIIDSKDVANDFNLNKKVKAKYSGHLNKYIDDLGKKTRADSSISNGFYMFYNFIIFILTLGAVFLTSRGNLSIETYFIIVPYITSGIETTNQVFEFMPYLKNSSIYVQRVKDILNFNEKPNMSFGDIENDDVVGFVDFDEVSYVGDKEGNPQVKDLSFRIGAMKTTLVHGSKNSGKRTIFKLLHRELKQDQGEITLDGINIFEYSKKVYTTNFNYVSTHPVFFNGSILYNLKMICKNKEEIITVLQKLNLLEYINKLPNKIYTNVLTLPFDKQYLLAIARTLLTKAEVIAIYEMPNNLIQSEKENIFQILSSLHGKRTIVIFSSDERFASISDKIIKIERGKIKSIEVKNYEKFIIENPAQKSQ